MVRLSHCRDHLFHSEGRAIGVRICDGQPNEWEQNGAQKQASAKLKALQERCANTLSLCCACYPVLLPGMVHSCSFLLPQVWCYHKYGVCLYMVELLGR